MQVEKTENEEDDTNFDQLIKESVKEALHQEEQRPVKTSQTQNRPLFSEPPIVAHKKNNRRKNKNKNKNGSGNNGLSNKDFPSLPLGAEKPKVVVNKEKQKPKKVDKIDFLKKPKGDKKNNKPVSYVEAEENPFAIQAKRSKRNKNKNNSPKNKKIDKNFPSLGGPPSTKGSILGETNKKDELEIKYGIVLNKKGKKRGGRR